MSTSPDQAIARIDAAAGHVLDVRVAGDLRGRCPDFDGRVDLGEGRVELLLGQRCRDRCPSWIADSPIGVAHLGQVRQLALELVA